MSVGRRHCWPTRPSIGRSAILTQVEEIYDPRMLDVGRVGGARAQVLRPSLIEGVEGDLEELLVACTLRGTPPEDHDEFAAMQISEKKADLRRSIRANFYFGCEADDRSTAFAYSP